MGYSSELAIAEANRDEAAEAIKLIEKVQIKVIEHDEFELAVDLQDAIELIKKFSEKHEQLSILSTDYDLMIL